MPKIQFMLTDDEFTRTVAAMQTMYSEQMVQDDDESDADYVAACCEMWLEASTHSMEVDAAGKAAAIAKRSEQVPFTNRAARLEARVPAPAPAPVRRGPAPVE